MWLGPVDDPDRYEVITFVGAGGEGMLYRGTLSVASGVALPVAIKMLHPRHRTDIREWSARWIEQVELLRSIHAPGVVPVRDGFIGPTPHPRHAGSTDELTLYLVMNWVDGKPLHEWADDKELAPEQSLRLLLGVAGALDLMHSGASTAGAPVIHGDIKPSNILVTPNEETVLVDFGLIRVLPRGSRETGVSGTLGYIAPEIWKSGRYSPSSDRYAFGGVAYYLLTAEDPPADGDRHRIERTLDVTVGHRPDVSRHVLALLDDRPDSRPADLTSWCSDLRQSTLQIRRISLQAPAVASPPRAAWPRRRPSAGWSWATVAAVAALVGIGLLLVSRQGSGSTSSVSTSTVAPTAPPTTPVASVPPPTFRSRLFSPAFALAATGWTLFEPESPDKVTLSHAGSDGLLTVLRVGEVFTSDRAPTSGFTPAPGDVGPLPNGDLVAWLRSHPRLVAGPPQSLQRSGRVWTRLSVAVANGQGETNDACPTTQCVLLFRLAEARAPFGFGVLGTNSIETTRVGGAVIAVALESPAGQFATFQRAADQLIDTLRFTP